MPKKIIATNITNTGKESTSKKVKAGECQFPFLHQGKLQNSCVKGKNGDWCATEVNKGRQMMKFGFCEIDKFFGKQHRLLFLHFYLNFLLILKTLYL